MRPVFIFICSWTDLRINPLKWDLLQSRVYTPAAFFPLNWPLKFWIKFSSCLGKRMLPAVRYWSEYPYFLGLSFPFFPLHSADLQAVNLLAFRSDSSPMSVAFSLDQSANRTTDTRKHRGGSGGDAACFLVLNPASTSLKSKQQANAQRLVWTHREFTVCKFANTTQHTGVELQMKWSQSFWSMLIKNRTLAFPEPFQNAEFQKKEPHQPFVIHFTCLFDCFLQFFLLILAFIFKRNDSNMSGTMGNKSCFPHGCYRGVRYFIFAHQCRLDACRHQLGSLGPRFRSSSHLHHGSMCVGGNLKKLDHLRWNILAQRINQAEISIYIHIYTADWARPLILAATADGSGNTAVGDVGALLAFRSIHRSRPVLSRRPPSVTQDPWS